MEKANHSENNKNGSNEEYDLKNQEKVPEIKVDIKQTLYVGFAFLSCMIAWSYYNFKIPIILNGIDGLKIGTYIRVGMLGTDPAMEIVGGALMTLDNIIAIILQPYFGRLSDRLQSKYGRRTPFFIIGLPTAAFCLFILPFCPVIGLFIAVIFVFNLAMAFYRPPVMSILPDKTPPQVLSKANSFISLMGGIGVIIGMLIPTIVGFIPGTDPISTGNLETQDFFWQDFWGFILTGVFMFACLVIFLIKVKEVPTGKKFFKVGEIPINIDVYSQTIIPAEKKNSSAEDSNQSKNKKKPGYFDEWHEILKEKDKSALWVLLAVFSYLLGFNAIEYSFGRFATSALQIEEGTAGLILSIMPVMLIVFAIPAGRLAEKYGRVKIMKFGLLLMALMTIGVIIILPNIKKILETRAITFVDLIPLIILLSIAGIGYGLTHINALPVVWQLSPKKKLGAYTGVYYMISALGSILSPLFMSLIYTLIRMNGGDQWVALFPYYLAGILIGFFFLMKVKRGDAEPLTKEEIAKLKQQYLQED
jgi:maltose/moltooligosaccharide transporter